MAVTRISDAPIYTEKGMSVTSLIAPSSGASEMAAWTLTLDPGASSAPHRHDHEELFVVLLGAGKISCGEHEVYVKAMDCVAIPAYEVHQLTNIGIEPWMLLSVLPVGARVLCPDGIELRLPAWME